SHRGEYEFNRSCCWMRLSLARVHCAVAAANTAADFFAASIAFSRPAARPRGNVFAKCRSISKQLQAVSAAHHADSQRDDLDRGGTNDHKRLRAFARWKDRHSGNVD